MNKKIRIVFLSVIAFLILSLTTTYGLWYVTRHQTNSNLIATKCLDISLTNEENDITLTEAYPITDEEGLKLTPYTFTVTNNCNRSIDYQLNLELLGDSEISVAASAIKVSLNDSTTLLSNKETRETTIENAYTSYQLMYGRLEAKESEEHSLRLWVDEDAPVSESNKVFESKISVIAGQGIENPFEEGTMAFNIVGNAGGISYVNELTTDISEIKIDTEEVVWIPAPSSLYWATDYEFDAEKGYKLSGDIIQATVNECREGTKECGNYMLGYNISSADESAKTLYTVTSFTSESGDWYITAKRSVVGNAFNFISQEDESSLNKTTDDLGDSYYYRGNVKNNYVKFGTWNEDLTEIRGYRSETTTMDYKTYSTLEECNAASSYNYNCTEIPIANKGDDMYWRIVRINGDGTIRLIYDGTEAVANGTTHTATIGTTAYNTNYDNAKYVGYTYENDEGTQTDSTIKGVIDAWYDTNLETNYGSYIADSIFCNDRTSRLASNDNIIFGADDRLEAAAPQLICNQKEDKYTISTQYGNGYLTNPVGLITADEVAMAGGGENGTSNNTFYLTFGSEAFYWTLSPGFFDGDAAMWDVFPSGFINTFYATHSLCGARPVINLKANVKFTGDGTIDNPYEIVME